MSRVHKVRCQRCGHWLANTSLVSGLCLELKCPKCCSVTRVAVENDLVVVQTDKTLTRKEPMGLVEATA